MLYIALIILICIYFAACGAYEKRIPVGEKAKKITKILSLVSVIAPIIAAVVFAVLFSFVLQGRMIERAAHAMIVLSMWICALQFYTHIISHIKNKKSWALSIIGFLPSVAMAIVLTPLDRYSELIYDHSQALALPFSIGILVFVYIVIIYTNPALKIRK